MHIVSKDKMVKTNHIHVDGRPVVEGHCVVPDHYVQTFTVTVRSLRGISGETLKNLIQKSYEVVVAELTAETCYVK